MAVNNKYAGLAQRGGSSSEKYDSFYFTDIGSKIQGKILEFSEPFEAKNSFYDPEKDPDWKKTVTTVKINLEQADGKRVSLYLNKSGHFEALGDALAAADLSDLVVGYEFVMAWTGLGQAPKSGGSRPHKFEAAIRKPE